MGNFVEVDNVGIPAGAHFTDWVRLRHASQAIAIVADNWDGLVARLEYSINGKDVFRGIYLNEQEIVCRRNRAEIFETPGHVRLLAEGETTTVRLIVYADPDKEMAAGHTLEEAMLISPGTSEWLPLTSLKDSVSVSSSEWSGTSVKMELSFDGRFVFPMGEHGQELICQRNTCRLVECGGQVRITAEQLKSPVRLSVVSYNVAGQQAVEQLTTNSLMIDRLERDPAAKDFTVRQWALAIERSVGSIQATKTWRALMAMREQAKIDRLSVQGEVG